MPLIFIAILISLATDLYPSAPSAAADVKRHAEVSKNYPAMPRRIIDSIYPPYVLPTETQFESVKQWLREDPRNKNAENPLTDRSILMMVIMKTIVKSSSEYKSFLDTLLSLEPDMRYQSSRDEIPSTALQVACWYAPEQESDLTPENQQFQIRLTERLIDLMLKQNFTYANIAAELAPVLAEIDSGIKRIIQYPTSTFSIRAWEFSKQVTLAAQEYLHDLQAAEIAEEALKKHLLPELAPIPAEYIAPKKRGMTQASPTGKPQGDSSTPAAATAKPSSK